MRPVITVLPSRESALYWNEHSVVMTDDSVGGLRRMKMHAANNAQVEWIRRVALPRPFILVDIGGNVGLFTRQALIAAPGIQRAFVYEPDPENFAHLLHNLRPWADRVISLNVALAEGTGMSEFFLDPNNCGNLSLLQSAMPPVGSYTKTMTHTVGAMVESLRWSGMPILYKSDTQGFDERIATLVDPLVWDATFAAIMEIWRIEKHYDVAAFREVLHKFSRRRFLGQSQQLTVDDVVEYSTGKDGRWLDLVLEK